MLRTAFTLIELLVVVAIVALLAALLFPLFSQARARARQTVCLSNTHQLAAATLQYAQDYDETLPMAYGYLPGQGWQFTTPGDTPPDESVVPTTPEFGAFAAYWGNAIQPYARNYPILACPAATLAIPDYGKNTPRAVRVNYAYNGLLQSCPLSAIRVSVAVPLITESLGQGYILGAQLANPQLVCSDLNSSCTYQPSSAGCSLNNNGTKSLMLLGPQTQGVHGNGQTYTYTDGHTKHKVLSLNVFDPARTDRTKEPWSFYKAHGAAGAVWKDANGCHVDFFRPDNPFQNG